MSANLISEMIKKKKAKGFSPEEHGAEEMEPKEAFETSEKAEKYSAPLIGATKPMGKKLGTIEKAAPAKLGSIKSMSPEDNIGMGALLESAKKVSEMKPESDEAMLKHHKLLKAIKEAELVKKKLKGK
jgi:hypothetical protein